MLLVGPLQAVNLLASRVSTFPARAQLGAIRWPLAHIHIHQLVNSTQGRGVLGSRQTRPDSECVDHSPAGQSVADHEPVEIAGGKNLRGRQTSLIQSLSHCPGNLYYISA